MNKWRQISLGDFIDFNPSERILKGEIAKKIPMAMLTEFERKIKGYEYASYNAGPKFRNGDTLVAKITPCLENGKTAQVDLLEDDEIAFGSSEFIVLRENQYSINDYIYYLAKSPVFRERAISCMEGTSGRKRVNEGALKRQEIRVPNKTEQRKIAAVLSALDDKIELNNKINSELEAMAKTLYDYWFVQFDFPDVKGKPYKSSGGKMVYNEELKREIPEGWEVMGLGEIESNIVTGKTPPTKNSSFYNGNVPFITIGDIRGNMHIVNTDIKLSLSGANYQKNKFIPKGSLCVSCIASPGLIGFATEDSQTNQQINSIVFNNEENRTHLYFYLNDFFKFAKGAKTGNTFANMNKGDFEKIIIIEPPKDRKRTFYQKSKSNFELILNNLKENQELSTLRDWLLPMMMNGQISVGDAFEKADGVLSVAAEDAALYDNQN